MAKQPTKPQRESMPELIGMTLREFKKQKRKEALDAYNAMYKLLYGAAYMPRVDGFFIGKAVEDLRRARREWQKWWKNA